MRGYWVSALLLICNFAYGQPLLKPWKTINAQGTREITPFIIDGQQYFAVSQLAKNIPHAPSSMNGGNSDVDVIILREGKGLFFPYQSIPSHGNEGSEFFMIGDKKFLAVASIRSGPHAPYNLNTYSKIYQWDGEKFFPIQQFFNLATKQWKHFQINGRHFLAQANGISKDQFKSTLSTNSVIYEWDANKFKRFQVLPSTWAYSWEVFKMNGNYYLALADHIDHSIIYKWNGRSFQTFQRIEGDGGRAFKYMQIGNKSLLAYANIKDKSMIYEFKQGSWKPFQKLAGAGGRNFTHFNYNGNDYLLRINFIDGTRQNPITELKSPLYLWDGKKFVKVQDITTFGGVSANLFIHGDQLMIAVANSLSKAIQFNQPSVIYQVGESSATKVA